MKTLLAIVIAASLFTEQALAQLATPQPSPLVETTQKVGLTDINVTYSRPGMKGRTVFGDMVPYGEIWRTGANMATTINISDDVTINGQTLGKGEYAIFSIPTATEWTIMFNKNTNQAGTAAYSDTQDALRVKVPVTKLNDVVETFTIDFSHFTTDGAKMNISWENTRVSVDIASDVDNKVMAQIQRAFSPTNLAGQYSQAASYFLDANKDLDQALTWINKALALYKEDNREPFWVIHTKAKIQAAKGDTKEAIKTAEYSLKLAKESSTGDFGYIGNNEKLIKELKAKK